MSAGGIGHGLAAAVNGFMKGRQLAQDWKDAEEEREWKTQERDRKRKDWQAQDDELDMRKTAGAPRVVEEVAGGESTQAYLKATEQGPAPETPQVDFTAAPKYVVAQQPAADGAPMKFDSVAQMYATRDEAGSAVQQANTPQSVAQRLQEGYTRLGNHEKAMSVATNQLSLEKLQEEAIERRRVRDFNEAATTGGFPGLIGVAKKYGVELRHEVGTDGKVRIQRVGQDGELTNLPFEFTNDQEGLVRAMTALDSKISPTDRLNLIMKEKEVAEGTRRWNATHGLNMRSQDRADRGEERQGRLTNAQIGEYDRKARAAEDEAKVPYAVKTQVQVGQKQLETINAAITKAMAEDRWDPNSESSKALLKEKAVLSARVNAALAPYAKETKAGDPLGYGASKGGQAGGKASGNVQDFVRTHKAAAEQVAKQLNVPVNAVLVLAPTGN